MKPRRRPQRDAALAEGRRRDEVEAAAAGFPGERRGERADGPERRAEREAHELNTMSELAKSVSKLPPCLIMVKTGDDGKMFGAVTAGMIADELKHQFDVTLDKRKIHLEHPIKALGEYEVELHLHAEVKGTLKVRVESTTPAPVFSSVTRML